MSEQGSSEQAGGQVTLQKIYVKDLSFESPNAPQIFAQELKPKTQLNLRSGHRELDDDTYEVVLTVTVEAKAEEKTVFLIEIQQAGLFRLAGISEEHRSILLGSFCPGVLYPYVREAVANVVQRGGFPEFLLQPIDFDGLYAQSRQEAGGTPAEQQN